MKRYIVWDGDAVVGDVDSIEDANNLLELEASCGESMSSYYVTDNKTGERIQ